MQTIVADSSQISVFDQCPTQWYFRYIKGLVKTPLPALEVDSFASLDGETGETVIKDKINFALMGTCTHHILEKRYKDPKLTISDCIDYGFAKIIEDASGDETKLLKEKERDRVANTLLLYDAYYSFQSDFKVNDPKNLELGFSQEIYKDDNYQFILEGRIDIVEATLGNGTEVMSVDHKSQGSAHNLYERCIQFRNYNLVSEKDYFCVNYLRYSKQLTASTFKRQIIPFSSQERRAWKEELILIFRRMASFLSIVEHGQKNYGETQAYYNAMHERRRSACSGMVYKCHYIPLCDSGNTSTLIAIANSNFHYEEPHKPW